MRIIKKLHLEEYAQDHPDAAASLLAWIEKIRAGDWATLHDVQAAFSKAKALGGDRVRFEIAGGNYRLIAAFDFKRQVAFVKFIGTHTEYDRIDARQVSNY